MIELNLYPLMGLFEELYKPDLGSLAIEPLCPNGRWSLERANGLFWAQLLSESALRSLLERVQTKYCYTSCNIPQYEAVLQNPDLFIRKVSQAPTALANQGSTPYAFFSALETLTVLCNLYSEFVYSPFKLTVDDGFLLDDYSSKRLVEDCLSSISNPYLDFLGKNSWPVLEAMKPDLVWMLGPIRHSTFALAMMARKAFPNIHISVVAHSSEYYSLNKIVKYLESNEVLFSIIDSIILDDTEHTQKQVVECIKNASPLADVPNLLYIDRVTQKITRTRFEVSKKSVANWVALRPRSFPASESSGDIVDPSEIANVKLWPNAKCYWNRCTFCGINHKYHTLPEWNSFEEIMERTDFIAQLVQGGCRYFWLIDEAVPPEVLNVFAQNLIARGLNVRWQARSRLDKGFSLEVCETLAKAGLKEIRLGLESANPRILKLMDKFPEDVDLDLVEQIVYRFHRNGVSVHFPMLVGFPSETAQERMDTFEFLQNLKRNYPSFTFNVNALDLDVSSRLFRQYDEFDITTIKLPCATRHFLGNFCGWDSEIEHFDKSALDLQRSSFMRQVLYPWMPKTAMTPTFIFYRLSETSRITLVWKSRFFENGDRKEAPIMLNTRVCSSPDLVYSQINRMKGNSRLFRAYDWESHNFIECDNDGVQLLGIFKSPRTIGEGLEEFWQKFYAESLSTQDVFAKYLPQLQIANQFKLLRIA